MTLPAGLAELEEHWLGQSRICWTCGDSKLLEDRETERFLNIAVLLTTQYKGKLSDGEMHVFKNIWPVRGPKKGWKFMLSALRYDGHLYAYVTIHTPERFGFCAPYFIAARVNL